MAIRQADTLNDGSRAAEKLEQWRGVWDDKSKAHQRRHFSRVFFAIIVGPLAVLFLAVQLIGFHDGPMAVGLISLEVAVLAWALCIPLFKLNRAHDYWLGTRVRAEVFQREMSLLFAQVGPYLGRTATGAADEVDRRFAILHGEHKDGSLESLAFTRAPIQWRNDLESSTANQELPDVRDRAGRYLRNRVLAQQEWFLEKSRHHVHRSEHLETVATIVLALALVVAVVHLVTLVPSLFAGEPHQPPLWEDALKIIALWLPAAGSAIVGYRSALGSQRQALSYQYYADAIIPLRDALERLAGAGQAHPKDALNFKRLVLDVEEVLSDELRQWWMNMVIKVPHTTA